MYQKFYSEFLEAHKDKIHMACHSHHFWPNIARVGHLESYEISQSMSDNKWDYIFGTLLPDVKKTISNQINFDRPDDISFASNTHELMVKIISSYFEQDKIRILTTKSEFHSLSRQLKRFAENNKFEITYIDNESDSFHKEMTESLTKNSFDLIILSHVFYNSGLIYHLHEIEEIVALKKEASFILDAYHGYCAVPTDISKIGDHIFYMAGGYKYAQAGEGMCFTTIPKDCKLRPQITGWFASFSTLESGADEIQYDSEGMRFWGSTMDFTAFFRFRKVWNFFNKENMRLKEMLGYINDLQEEFLLNNPLHENILHSNPNKIGSFITLEFSSEAETKSFHDKLNELNILTDFRGKRLRFGFGIYQSVDQIVEVKKLLRSE
jgi:selenocysteine lyase/cysteine desulfurase